MNDLKEVFEGGKFKVSMTAAVEKAFRGLEASQRARLQRWMKFYADDGSENLDVEKFKHEGKFPSGLRDATDLTIYAFKAWKVRLYGGHVGTHFIITEIDISKKQDKADRDLLKRAARKLALYQ